MKLERTPAFDEALEKMEHGKAFVFITGRAGTGKSTLLRHFVHTTTLKVPVLAPTGVAALNVDGETIHRFFKLPPAVDLQTARIEAEERKRPDIYRQIHALIIDEISMVRADLFDAMDVFLKAVRKNKKPFGGVRIIGIGDLHQLPPVVSTDDREGFAQRYPTPYFFSSAVYERLLRLGDFEMIELTTIYRQTDQHFITLLNAIRDRNISPHQLAQLNERVTSAPPPAGSIVLTPTNDVATAINASKLEEITAQAHLFEGRTNGTFKDRDMATDASLLLKVGARVMCVANDLNGKYVNGSLGWITAITEDDDGAHVFVRLDDHDEPLAIEPYTWTIHRTTYNARTHELEQESVGSFTQIPLRLAWAVTIHKSQGKTFDRVTLDLRRGAFASGQIYVALSRCRSIEGLTITKPVTAEQLKPNDDLAPFFRSLETDPSDPIYVEEDEQLDFLRIKKAAS